MGLINYTEEQRLEILVKVHRRRLYYKIHYLVNQLQLWTESVYRPLHPADKQSLLIFAKSIVELTTHIQNIAKDLIACLEEDNVSQRKESKQ